MPRRLLIVDDDPTIRTSLAEALADNGTTEVRVAEGPHRALALIDEAAPDVVLSDVRMPENGRHHVSQAAARTRALH